MSNANKQLTKGISSWNNNGKPDKTTAVLLGLLICVGVIHVAVSHLV